MDKKEIILQLQEIAKTVFKENDLVLTETSNFDDLKNWNSLTHIMFVDTVEKKFGFSFSFEDMLEITTVEGMCSKIISYTSK